MNSQIELNAKDIISGLGNLNQRFSGKKILLTGAAGFLGCQFMHYFMVLNGSGINETQGERLLEICKECWGSGWQHGHFVMDQTDIQETNTIDGHLESQYESVTNYGGTE